MSAEKFYICNYSDYNSLPSKLYTGHTVSKETKSVDDTVFIVRGSGRSDSNLSWMMGNEPEYDHAGIIEMIKNDSNWG
jgi:hypothetical protein